MFRFTLLLYVQALHAALLYTYGYSGCRLRDATALHAVYQFSYPYNGNVWSEVIVL